MANRGHELVRFPNGCCSVRPRGSGPGAEEKIEAMHSSIGPWAEANQIYVDQVALARRLANGSSEPLVLYDVGMGIAANALAAIASLESQGKTRQGEIGPSRSLRIISFENDCSGLELALENGAEFPFLVSHREKVRALLCDGVWRSREGDLSWQLFRGDFRAELALAPRADIIFYDFYSPAVCRELWTRGVFEALRAKCAEDGLLVTYVAATSARAALLLAGFSVGRGNSTDAKMETTLASPSLDELGAPLGRDWLAKLSRSSRPWPADIDPLKSEKALESLKRLPQFQEQV